MHPNDFVMARIRQAEGKHDAAFASDLGLKPGQWPINVSYEGLIYKRRPQPERNADGDIESFVYCRADGTLTVWND